MTHMIIIMLKNFNNQILKIIDRLKVLCNKKINWLYKNIAIMLILNKQKI